MKFEVKFYETVTQKPIETFICGLDEKTQIKIAVLIEKLGENPFELKDFSKKISNDLYELRLYYLKKWYRIIYAFEKNKIIILLHGFIKKSNKIPKKELQISRERLLEYRKRGGK